MSKRPRNSVPAFARQRGFSLVELMVAIAIGLVILAALATSMIANTNSMASNEKTSELQTNGRYALSVLKHDLLAAGFRAYTWAEPTAPTTAIGTPTNECLESGAAAGSFIPNIRQGVWGANDTNPFSANCIAAADFYDGHTDVLVVRGMEPSPVPLTAVSLTAGKFYFRSSYAAGEVFRGGQATGCPALTPAPSAPFDKVPCIAGEHGLERNDFAFKNAVYYLRPYTTSSTESPKVPALYRVVLQDDGSMAAELVASGVEYFQVQYGRTATDLTTQYFNANKISGTSSATAATEWDDVNAVRIWVLARSAKEEPDYKNTQTYTMGDVSFTAADGYRRELFSTTIQVRN